MDQICQYLSFPFVRYALIVGVLVSLCSSLLGVTLVLKRFSFIGDGLSHVAFFAMAVAAVLRFTNNMPVILLVTTLAAVLVLSGGQRMKLKGDAMIAMLSVGALALGYLLMNLFAKTSNLSGDVCGTLFGSTSILTLGPDQVWLCVGLSGAVLAFFLFFYHKIFAVTFDEDFAQATGVRARAYNQMLAVIIAVIIVLAMNLVGALLISALIVFPALSAMRVFKSFRSVLICSAAISVACSLAGILASILWDTPVGPTIVAADIAVFGFFSLAGTSAKRNG
ncbi:MAG: metal ABC transporter permease [Kiritimatiellae bacterium]|nr:metal ABC transporter permease [Kiritimatiellia bacterium]